MQVSLPEAPLCIQLIFHHNSQPLKRRPRNTSSSQCRPAGGFTQEQAIRFDPFSPSVPHLCIPGGTRPPHPCPHPFLSLPGLCMQLLPAPLTPPSWGQRPQCPGPGGARSRSGSNPEASQQDPTFPGSISRPVLWGRGRVPGLLGHPLPPSSGPPSTSISQCVTKRASLCAGAGEAPTKPAMPHSVLCPSAQPVRKAGPAADRQAGRRQRDVSPGVRTSSWFPLPPETPLSVQPSLLGGRCVSNPERARGAAASTRHPFSTISTAAADGHWPHGQQSPSSGLERTFPF